MNRYRELRSKQQKIFNDLPLGWAFGQKQFDEMMRKWGLDPEADTDKIYSIGAGGYVQKKDADQLHKTMDDLDAEIKAAIAADETGEGFIYEMFLDELENHEYGYTRDISDTLDALGYTIEDIRADDRLIKGLAMAMALIEKSDS